MMWQLKRGNKRDKKCDRHRHESGSRSGKNAPMGVIKIKNERLQNNANRKSGPAIYGILRMCADCCRAAEEKGDKRDLKLEPGAPQFDDITMLAFRYNGKQ